MRVKATCHRLSPALFLIETIENFALRSLSERLPITLEMHAPPPKKWWVCQAAVGMTIRINTDVIRNTSKVKFSTKKNHQMIVYWYNDGLEITKRNKYIHLFIHLRIGEVALLDFLIQEEIPGNHQMLAGICRKSPTYKLWGLLRYDVRGPWYLYNII